MALLILAHPSFTESVANKTIVDELSRTQTDLEIRHIHDLYPDYQIDIAAEQSALLRHELIILQCPMYWFSIPAILKFGLIRYLHINLPMVLKETSLNIKSFC